MPVWVSCPNCAATHPSRVRARSGPDFASLNAPVGAVLEICPSCGTWTRSEPGDRAWRDEAPVQRDRSTHLVRG